MPSSRNQDGTRAVPLSTETRAVTCECPISYHVETRRDGHRVAVWDEEPPSLMEMCFGRCQRCGLPYHTEFTSDEIVG